jgi:hypothetical protein
MKRINHRDRLCPMTRYQPAVQKNDEVVAFEKARFDYCVSINETENKRREVLENRSRFYLSFITLFLGAIFFNIEFLEKLNNEMIGNSVSIALKVGICGCIVILACALFISLISILASVQIKPFKAVYPEHVTEMLFGSDYYIAEESLRGLYQRLSMNYTLTLDHNKRINDRKAVWLKVAATGIYASVTSLFILLALFTYILLL